MKDIKGFEGLYAITEDGRVWSYPNLKRKTARWLKPIRGGVRILKKLKTNPPYYLQVCLYKTGCTMKREYIHRLVAKSFIPNPNNKEQANHINGEKTDNRVTNLEWCTKLENHEHARINGLTSRGERNPFAKLNADLVKRIKQEYRDKTITQLKLAQKYGVSQPTVALIISNKSWKWVN